MYRKCALDGRSFLAGWDLDSHLELRPVVLFDSEVDLVVIFKPLVASNRIYILVQVVKFAVVAGRDYPQEIRARGAVFEDDRILEADADIDFLNRSREEAILIEVNIVPSDVDEVPGKYLLLGLLGFILQGLLLIRFGLWTLVGNVKILETHLHVGKLFKVLDLGLGIVLPQLALVVLRSLLDDGVAINFCHIKLSPFNSIFDLY